MLSTKDLQMTHSNDGCFVANDQVKLRRSLGGGNAGISTEATAVVDWWCWQKSIRIGDGDGNLKQLGRTSRVGCQ